MADRTGQHDSNNFEIEDNLFLNDEQNHMNIQSQSLVQRIATSLNELQAEWKKIDTVLQQNKSSMDVDQPEKAEFNSWSTIKMHVLFIHRHRRQLSEMLLNKYIGTVIRVAEAAAATYGVVATGPRKILPIHPAPHGILPLLLQLVNKWAHITPNALRVRLSKSSSKIAATMYDAFQSNWTQAGVLSQELIEASLSPAILLEEECYDVVPLALEMLALFPMQIHQQSAEDILGLLNNALRLQHISFFLVNHVACSKFIISLAMSLHSQPLHRIEQFSYLVPSLWKIAFSSITSEFNSFMHPASYIQTPVMNAHDLYDVHPACLSVLCYMSLTNARSARAPSSLPSLRKHKAVQRYFYLICDSLISTSISSPQESEFPVADFFSKLSSCFQDIFEYSRSSPHLFYFTFVPIYASVGCLSRIDDSGYVSGFQPQPTTAKKPKFLTAESSTLNSVKDDSISSAASADIYSDLASARAEKVVNVLGNSTSVRTLAQMLQRMLIAVANIDAHESSLLCNAKSSFYQSWGHTLIVAATHATRYLTSQRDVCFVMFRHLLDIADVTWIFSFIEEAITPQSEPQQAKIGTRELGVFVTSELFVSLPQMSKAVGTLLVSLDLEDLQRIIHLLWCRTRYYFACWQWYYRKNADQSSMLHKNRLEASRSSPVQHLNPDLISRANSAYFLTIIMLLLPSVLDVKLLKESRLSCITQIIDILSLTEFCRVNFTGYKQLIASLLQSGRHSRANPSIPEQLMQTIRCEPQIPLEAGPFERRRLLQQHTRLQFLRTQQLNNEFALQSAAFVSDFIKYFVCSDSKLFSADSICKDVKSFWPFNLTNCLFVQSLFIAEYNALSLPISGVFPASTETITSGMDLPLLSRSFFHLGILRLWLHNIPSQDLISVVIPLAYAFVVAPVKELNHRANALMCGALEELHSRSLEASSMVKYAFNDHLQEDKNNSLLVRKIIPSYCRCLLRAYPVHVKFSSVAELYIASFHILSNNDCMLLYLMSILNEKLRDLLTGLRSTNSSGNNSLSQVENSTTRDALNQIDEVTDANGTNPQVNAAIANSTGTLGNVHSLPHIKPLLVLYMQMLQLVHTNHLPICLKQLRGMFTANISPAMHDIQLALATTLYSVLLKQFDLYRRDEVLHYLLSILEELHITLAATEA